MTLTTEQQEIYDLLVKTIFTIGESVTDMALRQVYKDNPAFAKTLTEAILLKGSKVPTDTMYFSLAYEDATGEPIDEDFENFLPKLIQVLEEENLLTTFVTGLWADTLDELEGALERD